jgi:hypothetical protein
MSGSQMRSPAPRWRAENRAEGIRSDLPPRTPNRKPNSPRSSPLGVLGSHCLWRAQSPRWRA